MHFQEGTEMISVLDHPFFKMISGGAGISEEVQRQLNRIEESAEAARKNTVKLIQMGFEHRTELRRTLSLSPQRRHTT